MELFLRSRVTTKSVGQTGGSHNDRHVNHPHSQRVIQFYSISANLFPSFLLIFAIIVPSIYYEISISTIFREIVINEW